MSRTGMLALALALLAPLCAGAQAPPAPGAAAPAEYRVLFHTTAGDFTLAVHRDWAPQAADRFHALVEAGYYDGNAIYRMIPGFVAQWGLNPDPAVSARWVHATLPDDPVVHSNTLGTVSFAAGGPHSRTTQVFVNLGDNRRLDRLGFAPFAEVVSGLDVVAHFAGDYGDGPPQGRGPRQDLILARGAAYLTANFPRLDVIYSAKLVNPEPGPGTR